MATRTVQGVEITADKIVAALIDRLIRNERELAALRKQVNENFETAVEAMPRLKDGKLQFSAVLVADSEGTEEFTVTVVPENVKPEGE